MARFAQTTKVIGCVDDDVQYAAETLLRNYYGQQGGLIDDVFMQHGQYGGWLGEKTLKRFYRGLPIPVQESLKMIKDVALSGFRDYAGDISRGDDWRKSALRRASEAGGTIVGNLGRRIMTGRGRKRNKRRRGSTKKGSSRTSSGRVGRRRKRKTTAKRGKRKAPARKKRSTKRKTTKRRSTKQQGAGDLGIGVNGWL
jgi:hypothetical protein